MNNHRGFRFSDYVAVGVLCLFASAAFAADDSCFGPKDLVLFNGKFLTVDDNETVASAIRIRGERIVAVSEDGPNAVMRDNDPCVDRLDLGGRTVIPGLIDSHTHIIRNANTPGYYLRGIETTTSVAELQQRVKEVAATTPKGSWITAMGGFDPRQIKEGRFPTLSELDAESGQNPVLIVKTFAGPAITNSLGKAFFESKGLQVEDNGMMKGGNLMKGLAFLYRFQPEGEFIRATADYFEFANSQGLTTAVDQADVGWFGVPLKAEEIPDKSSAVELWKQDELTLRLRFNTWFPGPPPPEGTPYNVEAFMASNISGLGDSMLKHAGVGEYVLGSPMGKMDAVTLTPVFKTVAAAGWQLSQHSGDVFEHEEHLKAYEAVNAEYPLKELRWSVEHVFKITEEQLERFAAMGVGVRVQNQEYLAEEKHRMPSKRGGPPLRSIVDSGIHVGAGTDATAVSPLSPWLNFYFMTTGKNVEGTTRIPADQTISRMEALRLYTKDNTWFTFDEDDLGSIEVGKLADLAVLSADFLEVSDEELRNIQSDLTLVGGKIVWRGAAFQ